MHQALPENWTRVKYFCIISLLNVRWCGKCFPAFQTTKDFCLLPWKSACSLIVCCWKSVVLKQLYDLCRVRGHSGCHCTPSVSVSVSFSLLQILLTPSTECGQTAAGVAADWLIVRGSGGLWFERFQPLKEEIVTSWTHNCPRETDLVTGCSGTQK